MRENDRQQRTISINWNNWKVFCVWQVFRARPQCNSIKRGRKRDTYQCVLIRWMIQGFFVLVRHKWCKLWSEILDKRTPPCTMHPYTNYKQGGFVLVSGNDALHVLAKLSSKYHLLISTWAACITIVVVVCCYYEREWKNIFLVCWMGAKLNKRQK